ncbi:DUF2025 family protein [Aquipseudomonas campi]|uniref:DUF2025 family protein n=1 Tax=Aquipseudomonas campi TaxID=2731681 RepID=A0A6M8FIZ3_9GAMM|nr:DUF2025 family protein [Pseudomonas campi]QKE63930.1 DUF2025 family protein [Pseudomonas campi]
MSITSASICAAADALQGFVGFNAKTGQHLVRFSEDSFGLDVPGESITPISEFVWVALPGGVMRLSRERLQLLAAQNIDDRLHLAEALHVYLRRSDLPEISAERRVLPRASA